MQGLARPGVLKAQDRGVKGLSSQGLERFPGCVRQFAERGLEAGPIDFIAQQRMADMRHMHANLMGAAGFQAA